MTNQMIDTVAAHIHHLSSEIGPRPSGSVNCHAAADYIAGQMRQLGWNVETQTFACQNWQAELAELTCNGKTFEVLANIYSPSCDVTASLVKACTLAELEAADICGKIALLYGDLTQNPLSAKSWFLIDEHDKRIIEILEQKAPAAVLTVQMKPGSINRIIEDWEFTIPSATLPAESALALFNEAAAPARLRLKTSQCEGETANLVARRPGQRPETLVLCAHYDTKFDTPGAGDNAAGVAALLGLAQHFSKVPTEIGLELVAFTNEEYLPIGDDTYLERAGEGFLDRVMLAVNFDGLGHILDANTLAIYVASPEFTACVEVISKDFPAVQWVDPWPESNHSTFSFRGVPALAFSSRALLHLAHQLDDTERWMNPQRIVEAVQLTARVVEAVQSNPRAWLRASEKQDSGEA